MTDTPKQAKFRAWLRKELRDDRIPTPSDCLLHLGGTVERTKYARGGPTISGHYSSIRIEEFEARGLVKGKNGRWAWPKEAS